MWNFGPERGSSLFFTTLQHVIKYLTFENSKAITCITSLLVSQLFWSGFLYLPRLIAKSKKWINQTIGHKYIHKLLESVLWKTVKKTYLIICHEILWKGNTKTTRSGDHLTQWDRSLNVKLFRWTKVVSSFL